MSQVRMVVVIHDTIVQGAYCSAPDAELLVVDWDVAQYGAMSDHVAEVPQLRGVTQCADVYRRTPDPWMRLRGTSTYRALRSAGMLKVPHHGEESTVLEGRHPHPPTSAKTTWFPIDFHPTGDSYE